MSGPRDYNTGTQAALFALAQRTCYYPDCPEPVIKMVGDIPVVNVQIAHVKGAKLGSVRYDRNMTDKERAPFGNLVLLCKPHHDLVDRVEPGKFGSELPLEWKRAREGAASMLCANSIG